MMRSIVSVIVGYIVMAVFIMVTLTGAWLALGPSFALEEGTTDVTIGWIAVNIPLSFIGALIGGFVCALIARAARNTPVRVLAGIIFGLGLILAVIGLFVERPDPQLDVSEMSSSAVASEAVQPTWYSFALPFVGAAGVLLGGKLRRPPQA